VTSAPRPADGKTLPTPKKWNPFSAKDTARIEAAFQKLPDCEPIEVIGNGDRSRLRGKASRSPDEVDDRDNTTKVAKVPVNEDYLFDVDVPNRELLPAYWLGPVYQVRRGSWYFIEGTTLRPCDENLALQLEEGYIKTKPWTLPVEKVRSSSRPRPLSGSFGFGGSLGIPSEATLGTNQETSQQGREREKLGATPIPDLTHRLFGSHLNSFVTYQDATSAYIVTDDFLSRMSGTVYQRFAGGAHFSGTKVIRGFVDMAAKKVKDTKDSKQANTAADDTTGSDSGYRTPSGVPTPPEPPKEEQEKIKIEPNTEDGERPESRIHTLERQMSSLITSVYKNPAAQDEQARQREEDEIRDDYNNSPGDAQDREIDHIMLITHGIGQRLGARFETFNFIHDINEFRKTLKAVYSASPDLQALNSEENIPQKNMRLQVIPVVWRHQLAFPQQSLKYNRKEYDLSDSDTNQDDEYPNLGDITVEGVPALRNIVADLALDILLYQTPAYKEHISRVVVQECNRIYKLFKERNPSFKGKVSLVGHSLGSAILFDLLSEQENDKAGLSRYLHGSEDSELKLDFEVEDLFCLGSPIGLFQMLKGKTVAGRDTLSRSRNSEAVVSSPKCRQLYNIFHPSDPISYRLEPLISSAMSSLKPQPLPYTKKTIFGTTSVASTITGIPARMGQSFTGFISNFSTGLATSFINKSLGISPEDAAKLQAPAVTSQQARMQQTQGQPAAATALRGTAPEEDRKRKLAQDTISSAGSESADHLPTLIDDRMETLFAGFQKRCKSSKGNVNAAADITAMAIDDESHHNHLSEAENLQAKRLRHEEAKVRALNANGRVDYSIQEGTFDMISFLAAIASHLAYWTDEDVSHFVISQLLSRQGKHRGEDKDNERNGDQV